MNQTNRDLGGIVCATRGGEGSEPTIERAIALARERGLRLTFLYIADLEFMKRAPTGHVSLAAELGLADSVTFPGLVKQDRLPYYYSAADVCVVPSYYESFGLVALESLACGTPVVASDVGDLRNIIHQGETGFVVPENTPPQLAGAIAHFLKGTPRDIDSINYRRASVSRFAWANVAADVAGELRLTLDSRVNEVTSVG